MTFIQPPLFSTSPCDWLVFADYAEDHKQKPCGRTCRAIGRLLEKLSLRDGGVPKLALGRRWELRPWHRNYYSFLTHSVVTNRLAENSPPAARELGWLEMDRGVTKMRKPVAKRYRWATTVEVEQSRPLRESFLLAIQEDVYYTDPSDPILANFLSRRPRVCWAYFRKLRTAHQKLYDEGLK